MIYSIGSTLAICTSSAPEIHTWQDTEASHRWPQSLIELHVSGAVAILTPHAMQSMAWLNSLVYDLMKRRGLTPGSHRFVLRGLIVVLRGLIVVVQTSVGNAAPVAAR